MQAVALCHAQPTMQASVWERIAPRKMKRTATLAMALAIWMLCLGCQAKAPHPVTGELMTYAQLEASQIADDNKLKRQQQESQRVAREQIGDIEFDQTLNQLHATRSIKKIELASNAEVSRLDQQRDALPALYAPSFAEIEEQKAWREVGVEATEMGLGTAAAVAVPGTGAALFFLRWLRTRSKLIQMQGASQAQAEDLEAKRKEEQQKRERATQALAETVLGISEAKQSGADMGPLLGALSKTQSADTKVMVTAIKSGAAV